MPPYRVIALGDSLTYGYPFGNPLSWVQIASERLELPILNQGINGDTLGHLLKRVNFDVLDLHPEFCTLLGGTNDIYQDGDVEAMKTAFTGLADKITAGKITCVVGLPPPISDSNLEKTMAKYRNWLKRYAKAEGLPVIDFHKPFLDKAKRILPGTLEDGVHPSSKGYQLMAEAAVKVLGPLLGK